jgi:hypothetical protein
MHAKGNRYRKAGRCAGGIIDGGNAQHVVHLSLQRRPRQAPKALRTSNLHIAATQRIVGT